MQAINQNKFGKSFYHLGPIRDQSLFEKVLSNKTTLDSCDYIICTGLFDEQEKNLQYYKDLLKSHISKKFNLHKSRFNCSQRKY